MALLVLGAAALGWTLLPGALLAAAGSAAPAIQPGESSPNAGSLHEVGTSSAGRARMAELTLELALEARMGGSSSLFSQVSASSAVDLPSDRALRERREASPETPASPGADRPATSAGSAAEPRAVSPGFGAIRDGGGGEPSADSSRPVLAGGEEVEVVLEAGRAEEDAARLAQDSGLEVTETRRTEDGALVARMRMPLVADPERAREALRDLERSPEVVEMRSSEGEAVELGEATAGTEQLEEAGELTDAEALARELLGEELPALEPVEAGVPWRFVLGMLTSLGLLVIAGLLLWSAQQGGGSS
ncbi:MAG TPA: hypothetical protein VMT85_02860 [Thermoanaerobaculia bacterium]|nr:hypothetical protein [Thermoanaerobaculia bacterium]